MRAEEGQDNSSDSDEEDVNVDIDGIAEKAVAMAKVRTEYLNGLEMKLDVRVGADKLYLRGSDREVFDTAAVPGVPRLDMRDFVEGVAPEAPQSQHLQREVRGAPVRPTDDKSLRKKERKEQREQKLDKWFGMQKVKMTWELEKELTAIKLRGALDPKRFYKAHDSKELPKYFHVATEVGGGLAPAGIQQTTGRAVKGRSFLDSALRDQTAQDWTWKKFVEVSARGHARANSGHFKKKGKAKTKSSWKKRKKG
jgi:hypothetical protein